MRGFIRLLSRDMKLALRGGGGTPQTLMVFATFVVFLPLTLGPDSAMIATVAPSLLWIILLLSALFSMEQSFTADVQDGSLDILLAHGMAEEVFALAKACAHWITLGLPLLVATIPIAVILEISLNATLELMLILLIATPALSLIGMVASAAVASTRGASLLVVILAAPLCVPLLIFATSAMAAALGSPLNLPLEQPLLLLLATTAFSLALAPIAAGALIRSCYL